MSWMLWVLLPVAVVYVLGAVGVVVLLCLSARKGKREPLPGGVAGFVSVAGFVLGWPVYLVLAMRELSRMP